MASNQMPGNPGQGNPNAGPGNVTSAAAEREQKMLDAATESFLQRIGEVKGTIGGLIAKLETDPNLNWPSFLDSYALMSSQLNSLFKNIKNERTPAMKKYICLPLALSPERDEELLKLSEGRVGTFSYDLVPHYLRTKPDPDVEQKHNTYETKANSTGQETANKQLTVMEKIIRETTKHISKERDELESKAKSRNDMEPTCSIDDTYNLVGAISLGRGLRMMHMMRPGGPPMPMGPQGPPQVGPPPGSMASAMGKAPSTIKTNIKGANQVHPYNR